MLAAAVDNVSLIQLLLLGFVVLLIALSPLFCWLALEKLIRLQKEALTELKILNSHLRNKGRNMD